MLGLSALPDDGPGIALATRQGTVKRVAPEWPAKGEAVEIVALRPGDEVVGAVELVDGEEELVLFASTGDLLRFPASAVRPQGRSAGGMAGMKLAAGATLVGFSAVDLKAPEGVLDVVDEPLVVTGGGLPPEGRAKGPGTVSSVKVTPLSEYPRKGRATGGVRCQRLLTGEALLVLGWAGRGPAWAAAASGDPVELPATYGRRDGSGTPVEKPPGRRRPPAPVGRVSCAPRRPRPGSWRRTAGGRGGRRWRRRSRWCRRSPPGSARGPCSRCRAWPRRSSTSRPAPGC